MRQVFILAGVLIAGLGFSQQSKNYGLKFPDESRVLKYGNETLEKVRIPPSRLEKFNFSAKVDLTQYCPQPGNQGVNQGSCSAWAVGYGLGSVYKNMRSHSKAYRMSPAFLFNSIKREIYNESDCTTGIFIDDALTYMVNNGICELSRMGYNQNSCSTLPDWNARDEALNNRLDSWECIYLDNDDPIGAYYMDEVKVHLSLGRPVPIGVWLDSDIAGFMDDYTPGKPKYVWKSPKNDLDKNFNYHAMLCVGYDDALKEFKVLNSYGPNSGNEGYVYISYHAFMNAVYEAYYAIDGIHVNFKLYERNRELFEVY